VWCLWQRKPFPYSSLTARAKLTWSNRPARFRSHLNAIERIVEVKSEELWTGVETMADDVTSDENYGLCGRDTMECASGARMCGR